MSQLSQMPSESDALPGTGIQEVESPSAASAGEINRLHESMHDIGSMCRTPKARAGRSTQISKDVSVVLGFASRYPEGRFSIDDESGTPLALLLAVREDLRLCDEVQALRVSNHLPTKFRDRLPSAKPT